MNIKLIYLYRDGANYKNYNEVVFVNPNKKSKEEIETVIKNHLIDDTWFVALNWNLPDMHFKELGYDPQIDHDWHEFESIEETVEVVTVETSIEDFLLVVNKTKLPW